MKLLPIFVRFQLRHKSWGLPTLWLPVVLLWPFVFTLLLLVFFLGVIVVAISDARSLARFTRLFRGLYGAICELRGTRIAVEDRENRIFIAIQ
jgi:hypothetical protein